jgi:membrane-bound lytic murein transglycosylase D
MVTRARILIVGLGVSSILTSSTPLPAGAEPFLSPSELEQAAVPPEGLDLGRLDPSMAPALTETGSGSESPLTDEVIPAASADDDPWAYAFAEAARVSRAPVPPLVAPYHLSMNSQVKFFLDRFTGERRRVVARWLQRSTRYLGMIREVLRARGLPDDLAFTAMIESGYDPVAVSRAGAKGLWQFMASTARRYGLRVDQWVDERLDPEKSTVAAATYLRDLHVQFGSWTLAQAAYNAGEVAVARAIRATRSTDFWVLAHTNFLRRETKEFVPQIHAATLIGREPARYGFAPEGAALAVFDQVSVPPLTDLHRLSRTAGVPMGALRDMNPVLIKGITPPGRAWDLKIPVGSGAGILAALGARPVVTAAAVSPAHVATRPADVHVVRPRETLSAIAQRYGISLGDVLKWNSLETRDRIKPGDRLRVAELRDERDSRAVR